MPRHTTEQLFAAITGQLPTTPQLPVPSRALVTRRLQETDPDGDVAVPWRRESLNRLLAEMQAADPYSTPDTPQEQIYRRHLQELAASTKPYVHVPPNLRYYALGHFAMAGMIPVDSASYGTAWHMFKLLER